MSELRIDRLRVEAFRGISGSVELDLRSPLTLLYAPNGTGKTTLCDAVEWLLTGRVQRLCANGDLDPAVLHAKFGGGAEPRVEAHLSVDGSPYFLRRTLGGASGGSTARGARPVAPTTLLRRLAPDAALDGNHHRTANRRREQYLRATHILTSEALAALVDTDEGTLVRRQEIFTDLLGVREEFDAADRLRRYGEALQPSQAGLEREAEAAGRELAALRAELAGAPEGDAADREAGAAEAALRVPPAGSGEDRLRAVAAAAARRRPEVAALDAALEAVDRDWASRLAFERDLPLAEQAEQEAGGALRASRESLARIEREERAAGEEAARLRKDLQSLRQLAGAVSARLPGLVGRAASTGRTDDGTSAASLSALRSTPEARLSPADRLRRRSEVRDLVRRTTAVQASRGRLGAAEKALSAAREALPEPGEQARLEKELGDARAALGQARARLRALEEPLQELRAAGRAFLDHDHGGAECPVCGHDWKSWERLRAAVGAMLGSEPGVVGAAEEAVAQANVRAVAAGQAWEAVRAALADVARQTTAVDALRAEVSGFEQGVARLGLRPERPDLPAALRRLDLWLDLAEEVSALEDAVGNQSRLLATLLPGDTPVRSLESVFAAAVERRSAELSVRLQQADARVAALAQSRAAGAAEAERREGEAVRLAGHAADLRRRREAFRRAWALVAGEAVPSERARAASRERARAAATAVETAERHLAAARAALTFRLGQERVRAFEEKLSRLDEELARIRRKRAAADRGVAAFEAHTRRVSRERLSALDDMVNPLFLRMHGNRVYDRIDVGDGKAGFLRWGAEADGKSFDPSLEFSQGQRQDLAIALFLARALSLRGTFVLDEPVVHLDDLNRIGLLDVLRAASLWQGGRVRLLVTTSSRMLARHLIEKFARVEASSTGEAPPLRVLEMRGNGLSGLDLSEVYPVRVRRERPASVPA